MERIHPTRDNDNVEGRDVPPEPQADPTLLENQFTTLENIPNQRENNTLEDIPTIDNETNLTDINERPGRTKRFVGAVAAFLALTVPVGIVVVAKNNNNSGSGEVVATSSAFPTTTTEAVIPPPKHETTTVPTTITPEIPKSERIYTLTGEATSLAKLKEESFTITTAEAPTPYDVAANHIGPMLGAVANFGVYRLNQGLHNLYTSPKTGARGLAAYNKDQLLGTDLLENTGLDSKKRAAELNILDILVERNGVNVSNNQFTKPLLSEIRIDESAPAMGGKKTSVIDAKLTLKQMTQDSDYEPKEGEAYRLQFYVTSDTAKPENWILEKGSFSIRK